LQRAQLLDDQEPEDDSRPAGGKEVLQTLPEAYAAQRSEINFVIGEFFNLVIENPACKRWFSNFQITQLRNYQMT
jgi:hypothetical protein